MKISVSIKPDKEGYTGRECPECEKYFKIKFGTGLPESKDCHCPYCNHIGPHDEFWTKQQIKYAQSVAMNKFSAEVFKNFKKLERKPNKNEFISFGITLKGNPTPITYYSENELEEKVTCNTCKLEYTIYGAFGFCPDCGIHNSIQIIEANFELVERMINLASNAEKDLADKLVENCLEDVISAFDGFGREHCSSIYEKISFQNIEVTRAKLFEDHGLDISSGLEKEAWDFVIEQFQKRHLLAHKMGIVDENFIRKTGKNRVLLGRKVTITSDEVRRLINCLKQISKNIFEGVSR